MSDKELYISLFNYIKPHESIIFICKDLFLNLVKLNEILLKKYLIKKYGKDKYEYKLKSLKKFLKKNNVYISSVPLLLVSNPEKVTELKNINIDDIKQYLFDEKILQNIDFYYKGFCPKKPLTRLFLLLKFPIYNFIKIKSTQYNKLSKTLDEMNMEIQNILDVNSLSDDKNIKKINNKNTMDNNEICKKIINNLLINKYENIISKYMIKEEKKYINISKKLKKINDIIIKLK